MGYYSLNNPYRTKYILDSNGICNRNAPAACSGNKTTPVAREYACCVGKYIVHSKRLAKLPMRNNDGGRRGHNANPEVHLTSIGMNEDGVLTQLSLSIVRATRMDV